MPRLAGAHTDVSPEDANRRTRMLLIALGAIVLIAVAFWFVVKPALSKSSDSAGSSAATTAPATSPSTRSTPKAVATPSASPSPSADEFSGSTRDPFAPLAAENVAATTTGTSPTSTAAPLPSVTADPNPAPATTPAGSHSLTLVTLNNGSADLTVDGKDKTVKAGDTVTKGVSCVKVSTDSVFVSYDSKAYAIAPGQTVSI